MAGGMDWFRWHHGSVVDPKFQLIARQAGARLGDVIATWAFALESASANADRGVVGNLDAEALDCLLGAEDGTAQRILHAMRLRRLIDAAGRRDQARELAAELGREVAGRSAAQIRRLELQWGLSAATREF